MMTTMRMSSTFVSLDSGIKPRPVGTLSRRGTANSGNKSGNPYSRIRPTTPMATLETPYGCYGVQNRCNEP